MHKWIRRGGCDHFGCNLPAALIRADESGRHGCVVGPARYRGRRGEDRRVQVPRDSLPSSTSTNRKKNRYFFFKKKMRGNEVFFFPHRSVSPKNHRRRQPGTLSTYEDRRHGRTKKKNVVSTGLRSIYVSCLVAHHQPACRPMQAPSKEKIFLYSVVYFPFSQ